MKKINRCLICGCEGQLVYDLALNTVSVECPNEDCLFVHTFEFKFGMDDTGEEEAIDEWNRRMSTTCANIAETINTETPDFLCSRCGKFVSFLEHRPEYGECCPRCGARWED